MVYYCFTIGGYIFILVKMIVFNSCSILLYCLYQFLLPLLEPLMKSFELYLYFLWFLVPVWCHVNGQVGQHDKCYVCEWMGEQVLCVWVGNRAHHLYGRIRYSVKSHVFVLRCKPTHPRHM